MMTMMILVGEGKGCTRHLTNSLSTQPDDDDDVDDDDVVLEDDSDDDDVHGGVAEQRCSRLVS